MYAAKRSKSSTMTIAFDQDNGEIKVLALNDRNFTEKFISCLRILCRESFTILIGSPKKIEADMMSSSAEKCPNESIIIFQFQAGMDFQAIMEMYVKSLELTEEPPCQRILDFRAVDTAFI